MPFTHVVAATDDPVLSFEECKESPRYMQFLAGRLRWPVVCEFVIAVDIHPTVDACADAKSQVMRWFASQYLSAQ
jgi:hypothetical protein